MHSNYVVHQPQKCLADVRLTVFLCLFVFLSSTLSKCCHAMVALLYPFTWQHTYIPVLPPSMIDIVCSPTPFLIGLLSSSLPRLKELPVEEVRQEYGRGGGAKWMVLDPRSVGSNCTRVGGISEPINTKAYILTF